MTYSAGPQKSALSDLYDVGWILDDETGYSEDEAYAFLTANVSGAFPQNGVLTASANPKAHTGAMVALIPSRADLERLALEGGEELEELHLTLAYLGEADAIDEDTRLRIMEAAGSYFTDVVSTEAFSVNVFNPHNAGMETAVVLGIKGEQLAEPHTSMMSAVRGVFDGMPDNHKPWIPHVTLKYTEDVRKENQDDFLSRLGPITFDTLRFAFADENIDVPLSAEGPLVASTRHPRYNKELNMDIDDLVSELLGEPITAAVNRMPPALKKYWLGPKGSARVGGWGNEGSYTACQKAMRAEGVDAKEIDGLCANLYHAATGQWPGRKKEEHALTAAAETPLNQWEGVLAMEGVETGDGRLFRVGSLDWAQLPLKLMYQPANTGGHSNSVLVGQITHVWRDGNKIMGRGIIDREAKSAEGFAIGHEVHRLMSEKYLNGVSVDVDKVKDADVELKYASEVPTPFEKPTTTVFNRGRVRGATLVAFPAFVEASIHLTGQVLTASAFDKVLTRCGCSDDVLVAASHTITIPDVPPAWWFNEPTDVEVKGALTITDEGRVFGFLAPGGVTHRSVNRKAPRNVNYSKFKGAETIVAGADGSIGRVKTGPVTFNCGHADTDPQVYGTLDNRKKHYDNSCSVFADINIGEDSKGNVWVAGAVKHYADAAQISQAMSCRLSGDWQPDVDRPGVTEFIAALLVPVPGFAMARKEASVKLEDGTLVSSAIPVEFAETALLTAAYRKKEIYRKRIGSFAERHKLELAKRLGRVDGNV